VPLIVNALQTIPVTWKARLGRSRLPDMMDPEVRKEEEREKRLHQIME
jgi:hypothetical protein